jgi:hypothetical protein
MLHSRFLALLLALGLLGGWAPGARADTIIENGDGTVTLVKDNDCWMVVDEADHSRVLDSNCGSTGEPEVQIKQSSTNPGYGGIEETPQPVKKLTCTNPGEECDPSRFKQNGSMYFNLYYCPTDCGWEAYDRVKDVIDTAWDKISLHLGAQYGTKVKGYIYTTGSGYKEGSGAPSWSGGVFKPGSNQIHVPAPLGRSGWDLEELLIHELTHFRLQERTFVSQLGDSAISNYKFLNEGIAQQMEQVLFEDGGAPQGKTSQRRRSLWTLKQVFEQGGTFMPYKSMMFQYGTNVHLFYAQSWATVAYITDRWGSRTIDGLLDAITTNHKTPRKTLTYPIAAKMLKRSFQSAFQLTPEELRQAAEGWARDQVAREF